MSWFLLEYKQTSRLTQRIAHRADSIAVSYCNKCLDRYNNRARMTPCFLSHRAAPIALNLRVTGLDHVYFSTLSLSISIALNLITLHSCVKSLLKFHSTSSCAGKQGVTCRQCFNKVTIPLLYFAYKISIAVEHILVNKSRHVI